MLGDSKIEVMMGTRGKEEKERKQADVELSSRYIGDHMLAAQRLSITYRIQISANDTGRVQVKWKSFHLSTYVIVAG